MSDSLSRRSFAALAAGAVLGGAIEVQAQDKQPTEQPKEPPANPGPTEAPFERDYMPPEFKPSWKRPQINRLLVQDFVIFAHTDLDMVKKLLVKEPALVLASINWGAGDWESGLGAASHMGRRDIVELLLERGARIDIFCVAMLGMVDVVKAMLTLQPKLIDAKGPHGFSLHFHAQVGGKEAEKVLDYLQSVKQIELKPNPFLKKPETPEPGKPG
jgi:hypothetical protein